MPGVAECHAVDACSPGGPVSLLMLVIRRRSRRQPCRRSIVQVRADPHDCGALFDRHEVVLRGAHRQVLQAVLVGQLAQRGEPAAALLAGPATAAASSSGPPPAPASARCSAAISRGAMPALPASPATFTSSRIAQPGRARSRWRSSSRSADSEATEWIRRTCGTIARTRRLCSCADEVPLEQLPVRRDLLLQILRAVLAHERARPPRPAPAAPRRRRTWSPPASRPRRAPAPCAQRRALERRRDLAAHALQVRAHPLRASSPLISSTMPPPPGVRRARLRGGGRRSARRRSCTPDVAHAADTRRRAAARARSPAGRCWRPRRVRRRRSAACTSAPTS